MRILVTGGAGFIGSHYVRSLLAGEYDDPHPDSPDWPGDPAGRHEVTVLDKLTYAGNRTNLPDRHDRMRFVHGDVCDARLLGELLPGHDAVLHLAAESHVDRSVDGAAEFARTNVQGTQSVLEAALRAGVPRVVHVSTDEVYGSIESGSWTEERPLLPNSPYAASKAGSDLLARSYWRTHGLHVSITRCCNNYGPFQHPEKVIPLFVTRLLEGRPVPLYGDGRNVREWLHVDDHCRALHRVLTHGGAGEIYNIGGGDALTNLELTEQLLELCGADRSMVQRVTDRPGHDLRYALDDSKVRDQLGYRPRIGLADGLADTVAWYRAHTDWWRAARERADELAGVA